MTWTVDVKTSRVGDHVLVEAIITDGNSSNIPPWTETRSEWVAFKLFDMFRLAVPSQWFGSFETRIERVERKQLARALKRAAQKNAADVRMGLAGR